MTDFIECHEFVDLSAHRPAFHGGENIVYIHPNNESQLIKVLHPTRRMNPPWYKKFRRDYRYIHVLRYLSEYIAYQIRSKNRQSIVAIFHQLVDTDHGIGLVFERVRDFDGATSMKLNKYVEQNGFDENLRQELEQLFEEVLQTHLVIGDLMAKNILVSRQKNGSRRLIFIDGLGEKTLLPLSRISRRYFIRRTLRYKEKMLKSLSALNK